jgi:hypothetical protein
MQRIAVLTPIAVGRNATCIEQLALAGRLEEHVLLTAE